MLFNSWQFLFFFPIVSLLYFLLPHRFRWVLLLAASCFFYMAFIPAFILILLITIVVDYAAGILMERIDGPRRKLILVISIVSTCAVLFLFKYFNFVTVNVEALAQFLHWNYSASTLSLVLPIGLSFHTFQSLSYVIEVYRRRQKAERHFGIYALYVMFYPQLVAGPIERPQNLLCQFYEKHHFDYIRVTHGLKLMAWGFFKKVVIADRLALFVNSVYDKPTEYQGISFLVATIFFAFQIYCDFSGYSDIAIGAAQVMGFRLMQNFRRPYFAASIAEFWKRWHISLSTWFRDYLYVPLGGSRVSQQRWLFNILGTFIISGLWHGAKWTFVIWGALNGCYLVGEIWLKGVGTWRELKSQKRYLSGLYKCVRVGSTFCLVCFSWIFFRADSVQDALYIVRHLFDGVGSYTVFVFSHLTQVGTGRRIFDPVLLGQSKEALMIVVFALVILLSVQWVQRKGSVRVLLAAQPWFIRWSAYYFLLFMIVCCGVFEKVSFIYFQF